MNPTLFAAGEVVVLPFTYSDLQSSKHRPAIVIVDTNDADVLVAKITSKHHNSAFDIALLDWESVGLITPSFVRLHKLLVAKKEHVIRKVGRVSNQDLLHLSEAFRSMF